MDKEEHDRNIISLFEEVHWLEAGTLRGKPVLVCSYMPISS